MYHPQLTLSFRSHSTPLAKSALSHSTPSPPPFKPAHLPRLLSPIPGPTRHPLPTCSGLYTARQPSQRRLPRVTRRRRGREHHAVLALANPATSTLLPPTVDGAEISRSRLPKTAP